jgi:hypothetical protein
MQTLFPKVPAAACDSRVLNSFWKLSPLSAVIRSLTVAAPFRSRRVFRCLQSRDRKGAFAKSLAPPDRLSTRCDPTTISLAADMPRRVRPAGSK